MRRHQFDSACRQPLAQRIAVIAANGNHTQWFLAWPSTAVSPGQAITKFTSEAIYEFHWSPDGKELALVGGHGESNAVLFRESTTQ
jgi:hypothetical protein